VNPEPFPPILIAPFLLAFVGLWLVIGAVLSAVSGWSQLAATYPGGARPVGRRLKRQVVGMGVVGENGVTTMVLAPDGLYLYSHPLFRFRRPPVLVPWKLVAVGEERGLLWWRYMPVTLASEVTMRVKPKAAAALSQFAATES